MTTTVNKRGTGVVQIEESYMPATRALKDKYRELAKVFLREHATGMCHDLIKSSLPLSTKGAAMAWSFDKVMKNHQKTVGIAFRPIKSRTFGQYLLNQDWASCEAYGFKSTNKTINSLISQKKWADVLQEFMRRGGITPDGLGRQQVEDRADLEMLYKWKKGRKPKGGKKPPIYVRKPQSIQTLMTNNSVATRVGLMAGGWMIAAKALGNKPDKRTKKVTGVVWLQNKGRGSVEVKDSESETSISITNDYANIGNWMNNPSPRAAVKKRHDTMNLWFSQIWDDAVKATGFETKNNA
jgi:hypothetical protein